MKNEDYLLNYIGMQIFAVHISPEIKVLSPLVQII